MDQREWRVTVALTNAPTPTVWMSKVVVAGDLAAGTATANVHPFTGRHLFPGMTAGSAKG